MTARRPGTIRILDLFSGAGGLSLGFDLIRDENGERVFEIVKAVEIDEDACGTLRNYFKKAYGREDVVFQGDLTQDITRQKVIESCKGNVPIIVGGPPCQSFSTLGPRSGYGLRNGKYKSDERDRLYQEYLKIVEELEPAFIIFENVKGILSKRDGRGRRYIDIIASDFKGMGYSFESENPEVAEDYLVLNAADYGVPQIRERVFLIGNNLRIRNPYPERTHYNPAGSAPQDDLLPWTTIRDAIGDLPKLKAKYTLTGIPKKRVGQIKLINARRFSGAEKLPFDKTRFMEYFRGRGLAGQRLLSFVRSGAAGVLLDHEARAQKEDDVQLFAEMEPGTTAEHLFRTRTQKAARLRKLIKYRMRSADGEFTFGDKYRKQDWDRPCTTLFAHLEKDGNRFIHPDGSQTRTLTVREAARIQTFPDWYEFSGSRGGKFRQIGNAVPPLLAHAIANSFVSVMARLQLPS